MDTETQSLVRMFRQMFRIRTFEERVGELFLKGGTAGSMLHLSIGEESAAVGVGEAMNFGDGFTTHHRGHGIFLARGADPKKMMAEIGGKEDGYCRGKGGSMHIADNDLGHLGANAIVGGGIPTVVGAGLSYKLLKKPNVSIAFFGDGAMQQGILYESMNMASLWKLPVVFCCINNQYGMGTKIDNAVGKKNFSERAKAFGLNTLHIKHLDAEKSYFDIKNIVDDARNNIPAFIEVECYRFYGHARKDKSPYRSEDEEIENRKLDPIMAAKEKLINEKLLSEIELKNINISIEQEMDSSMEFAINASLNDEKEIFSDVYGIDHTPESVDKRIQNILNK